MALVALEQARADLSSSALIWVLSEGWATWSLTAARLKLSSSATAVKYWSWRNFIIGNDYDRGKQICIGLYYSEFVPCHRPAWGDWVARRAASPRRTITNQRGVDDAFT